MRSNSATAAAMGMLVGLALAVGAATALVLRSVGYPRTGVDDADIFFAYSRHLAAGEGLVYNAGGEHVEGFTSLMWVLIGAAAYVLEPQPERLLLGLNMVLLGLVVAVGHQGLRRLDVGGAYGNWVSAAFAILLLGSPGFVMWMTAALMENALWALLLTGATVLTGCSPLDRRGQYCLGAVIILLALTRPESMVWIPFFLAAALLRRFTEVGRRAGLRYVAPLAGLFGSTIVALLAFRWTYFGYLFPNTYYAKVQQDVLANLVPGVVYFGRYVLSGLLPFCVVTSVALASAHFIVELVRRRRVADPHTLVVVAAADLGFAIPVLVGGDHFGAFRFFQNTLPIQVLAMFLFVGRVLPLYVRVELRESVKPGALGPAWAIVGTLLVLFQFGQYRDFGRRANVRHEFDIAATGRVTGGALDRIYADSEGRPMLGVVTAGGIRMTYTGGILDLMGLNSTAMAHANTDRSGPKNHAAFDKGVFYAARPGIVVPLAAVPPDPTEPIEAKIRRFENEALKGLFDEERFVHDYSYAVVALEAEPWAVEAWFRRDVLHALRQNPRLTVIEYPYGDGS